MKTRAKALVALDEATPACVNEPLHALEPPARGLQEWGLGTTGFVGRGDRFLSCRAASAMTGDASRRKIRRWVDRGEFNTYALDGRTVYSESEVLRFPGASEGQGPGRPRARLAHPGGAAARFCPNAPATPQKKTDLRSKILEGP
jgi:hypothetical protein